MIDNNINKNLLFGYLTCKRLIPNYAYFCEHYKFGNTEILYKYLKSIREIIVDDIPNIEIDNFKITIDNITPLPQNFKTILASSAMDACGCVYELISFINDKDINSIETISTLATDSVDMYIQINENINPNDPLIEQKIQQNPLMLREKKIQEGIRNYLNKIEIVTSEDIDFLEKMQYNNGKGNLDL